MNVFQNIYKSDWLDRIKSFGLAFGPSECVIELIFTVKSDENLVCVHEHRWL